MSIHRKTATGVFWSFLEKGGAQIASLFVFAVVAKIVGPEEYGLVSICMTYVGFVTTLFCFILDGVVSKRHKDDIILSTAFWGAVGCGLFFSLLGIALAYPVALLFDQPRLFDLLIIFSIVPVLLGMSALPNALYAQAMNFKIPALRTLIATVSGGVVGVTLALHGFGAMAIVLQQITYFIVINVVLWSFCHWYPKLQFDFKSIKDIFFPGFKTSGSYFAIYAQEHLPRIFIGLFLSVEAVGLYAFATRITAALCEIVFSPFYNVAFPTLSALKNDTKEQAKILSGLVTCLGLFLFPSVTGLAVIAPLMIPLLFGPEWLDAIVILRVILFSAIALAFTRIISSAFRAHNAMGTFLNVNIFTSALSILLCLFLSQHSLLFVAIGYSAAMLTGSIIYTIALKKILSFNLFVDYAKLWPVIMACGIMVSILIIISPYLNNDILSLIAMICIGGVTYTSVVIFFFIDQIKDFYTKFKTLKE